MMKILGWILTLIGSNGLTGTLVAKNSLRYSVDSLTEVVSELVGEHLAEFIGPEQGLLGSLIWAMVENLTDNMDEFFQADQGFVATIDTLFYVSIGVLILGVALLAAGYIKSALERRRAKHVPEQEDVVAE